MSIFDIAAEYIERKEQISRLARGDPAAGIEKLDRLRDTIKDYLLTGGELCTTQIDEDTGETVTMLELPDLNARCAVRPTRAARVLCRSCSRWATCPACGRFIESRPAGFNLVIEPLASVKEIRDARVSG